ncbi:MAG TPA: GNAT family N-acetyltransferase [Pseudonocardiaceae bacterium]|jgi:predicted N-acetyltransferase YhbS|nr:GNAT family N-acetyltransferase [Pseudonocardiaceae bacterium]
MSQYTYAEIDVGEQQFSLIALDASGRMVGNLIAGPRRHGSATLVRFAEIGHLHVDKESRRAGVATEMVRLCLAWARGAGYERVSVEVTAESIAEMLFYENIGFTPRTMVLDIPASQDAAYCAIHEHYKWCEHNGGVLGPTGYEAPPARRE